MTDAAGGGALAVFHLPPRRSFGFGATVTDGAGTTVAWLRSPHPQRMTGMSQSSYNIFAARPARAATGAVVAPAVAVDAQGTMGFHWATVTRKPFTNKCTITDPAGQVIYSGRKCMGLDTKGMQTWLMENASGQGVAHVSRLKGSKPPTHDIRVAQGADPAFALCCMFASVLAVEELRDDHTNSHNDHHDMS